MSIGLVISNHDLFIVSCADANVNKINIIIIKLKNFSKAGAIKAVFSFLTFENYLMRSYQIILFHRIL